MGLIVNLVFIIAMGTTSLAVGAEREMCRSTSAIPFLKAQTETFSKLTANLSMSLADQDLKSFCEWNRMDRVAESLNSKDLTKYRDAKNMGDLTAAEDILTIEAKSTSNPWLLSMMGTTRLKAMGKDTFFTTPGGHFDAAAISEDLDVAKAKSKFGTYNLQRINVYQPTDKEKRETCSYLTVNDTEECLRAIEAVKKMTTLGMPKADISTLVVDPERFERVTSDSSYADGLYLAAKTALKRVQTASVASGTIFSDLKDSFLASGKSQADAEQMAWDAVYLYSLGGPNLALRGGKDIFKNFNMVAGQAFVESVPKLDGIAVGNNSSIYSLPPGANFNCDVGKSYHFWMTAYFARELTKQGFSVDTAAKVAYMTAMAYHLNPPTYNKSLDGGQANGGRVPLGKLDYARFGTLENGLRIDLNLAAAGAYYGATGGKQVGNIKAGFVSAINAGGLEPNDTNVENDDQYGRWLRRLNPATILNFYAPK